MVIVIAKVSLLLTVIDFLLIICCIKNNNQVFTEIKTTVVVKEGVIRKKEAIIDNVKGNSGFNLTWFLELLTVML